MKGTSANNSYARALAAIRKAQNQISASLERLIEMCSDQSYETRMEALEALDACLPDLEPLIRRAIHDRDELVRTTAAEIAGARNLRSMGEELIRRLKADRSSLVRSAAAVALGDIGAEMAFDMLEDRISKADDQEKVGIYYSLAKLGARRYLNDFLNGLEHDFYLVRCATANLLPQVIDDRDRPSVRKRLTSALKREKTVAARSSLSHSLAEIDSASKRASRG